MKYLMAIPMALLGCLVGAVLLGIFPGLAFSLIWYGDQAFRHPEPVAILLRPGAIIGCIAAIIFALRYPDFWKI